MKYLVMLGDGMADYPSEYLNGKTPLEVAKKPYMDFLAQHGCVGMATTVPEGMPPSSDTANLSVMGYDPYVYYTGRSPLEAVSMGIDLDPSDIAIRMNLVTLTIDGDYEDGMMKDYSSDEISTEEARELVLYLDKHFHSEEIAMYPGISYRHCLVLKNKKTGAKLTPPHDITGKPIKGHLPEGENGELLASIMKKSYELLKDHPVNQARIKAGKNPANSCWFWGEGTKPALSPFSEKYGVKGGVISAVDLIKGIGLCAKMQVKEVAGATGNIHTNFKGKGEAALALYEEGCDLVYIHVEAPDESGHRFEVENKVSSIERIDAEILGPVIEGLKKKGEEYAILLMPDHPTPLALRTHVSDPVPFVLYSSAKESAPNCSRYTEAAARETGLYLKEGFLLMEKLIKGTF